MGKRGEAGKQPKRKNAASDRQLSKPQRDILMWLIEQEMDFVTVKEMKRAGSKFQTVYAQDFYKYAETINREGIPWSAELFLNPSLASFRSMNASGDIPEGLLSHVKTPTRSQQASISRSLEELEKRGLVIRRDSAKGLGQKPRTTHVMLTKSGRDAATQLSENSGMSEREARAWRKQANEALLAYVERELPDFEGHISLYEE